MAASLAALLTASLLTASLLAPLLALLGSLLTSLPGALLAAAPSAPLLVLLEALLVRRPIGLASALLTGVRARRLAAPPAVLLDRFVHAALRSRTLPLLVALSVPPVAPLSVVQLAPPVLSVVVLTHSSRRSVARRSVLSATVATQGYQRPLRSKCCHR